MRRTQPVFEFKTKCFYCEHEVITWNKWTKATSEILSKNKEIDTSIIETITSWCFDEWALSVLGHLEKII